VFLFVFSNTSANRTKMIYNVNTFVNNMGSHGVSTRRLCQYCVLYLAWWSEWTGICRWICNIDYLYMLCYWLNKLLYQKPLFSGYMPVWNISVFWCEQLSLEVFPSILNWHARSHSFLNVVLQTWAHEIWSSRDMIKGIIWRMITWWYLCNMVKLWWI